MIVKALNFTWSELKKRPVTWFSIQIRASFSCVIIIFLFWGIALYSNYVFFDFLKNSLFLFLFYIAMLAVIGSYVLYNYIGFSLAPFRNVLDAIEGKELRYLNDRVQSVALVFSSFFMPLVLFVTGSIITKFFILISFEFIHWINVLYWTAIFFRVRFGFAFLIILDEQCGFQEALTKSWKLTKGFFWMLLFADIVLIAPILFIETFNSMLLVVLLILIPLFPITALFKGSLYSELKIKNKNT